MGIPGTILSPLPYCLIRGSQLDSLLSRPFVFRGSLDFVLQLRAEEGMDTVLQSLVLLLG